jgi:hypothetical protein
MAWKISRLSSSLIGLWREPETGTGSQEQLQLIRSAMLDCITLYQPAAAPRPTVCAKVLHAYDIQSL